MVPDWEEMEKLKVSSKGILSGIFMDKKFLLDLDTKIGNNRGKFELGGENFSKTAKNIKISTDGTLSAELKDFGVLYKYDEIDLNKLVKTSGDEVLFIGDKRNSSRRRTSPRRKKRYSPRRKQPIVIQPGASVEASCAIL